MTTWLVVALVYAAGVAQQSQGLVSQSTLPPPTAAGTAETPKAKPVATKPAGTEKPAPVNGAKTRAEAPTPAPVTEPETTDAQPVPKVPAAAPAENKPVADTGTRVAAFWFILPRK